MQDLESKQQEICNKFQSEFCPVSPNDMVAIALQTLGESPIYGAREHKTSPTDNVEWFFYCGDYSLSPDFYKPIHAGHLAEYLPLVEKYLSLAPGYRFIIDVHGYEDVWQE